MFGSISIGSSSRSTPCLKKSYYGVISFIMHQSSVMGNGDTPRKNGSSIFTPLTQTCVHLMKLETYFVYGSKRALIFFFPTPQGPAYLLTSDVVSWLGEMLERNFLRLFHSAEDANVGVWLAGTNVRLLDDRTFMTSFAARLPKVPCDPMWNAVHRMRNFAQMLEWSRNWELCGCMCSCDPHYLSTKLVASRRAAAANKKNRRLIDSMKKI
jgi:hypothetical protein